MIPLSPAAEPAGQRIVIVDDNLVNLALFKALVKGVGEHEILTFSESGEALAWCQGNQADLLLIDYMMPPPDGLTFVHTLRQAPGWQFVPVIMITADHERTVRYRALSCGATDFLTKPVDKIEFQARVANLLALRLSQKQLTLRAEWLDQEVARATSDLKDRERELARQKEWLEVTLHAIGEAVIATDAQMQIELANPAAAALTGLPLEMICGRMSKEVLRLYQGKPREPLECPVGRCMRERGRIWLKEPVYLVRADGSEVIIEATASPICLGDGEVVGAVIVFHDVTERSRLFQEREHMAFHDALTDLPNRALLMIHLSRALLMARRQRSSLALLFLDLDDFKPVNDRLGHGAGDAVLVAAARRLCACLRKEDVVARVGGDEFIILLQNLPGPRHAAIVAEKILDAMLPPFALQEEQIRLGVSIGIALFPDHGEDEALLIQQADLAMYEAKQQGKNLYCIAPLPPSARSLPGQEDPLS